MYRFISSVFLLQLSQAVFAHPADEEVTVEGRKQNLMGEAISASEGVISNLEIELRPLPRTGDLLEYVPGMVSTQHSGSGKANQYFLRGFNLDHGTDFATIVDGMPVNMRSHGHGQGYTDLNFVIPETVSKIAYKKGAYYADVGDFSGAGSAQLNTASSFNKGKLQLTLGEDNYTRLLAMDSFSFAGGTSLFAVDGTRYDGPWSDISEDVQAHKLFVKHSMPAKDGSLSFTLMAYNNDWNSADQIPSRAVQQGLIDELGSIDDTVGGETHRTSVSMDWQSGGWKSTAYLIDYGLNLWSNFSYFLEDETNGDQFEQVDDRLIYGGELSYTLTENMFEKDMQNRFGLQLRIDDIDEVALYNSRARERIGTVRKDQITESSLGLFWENTLNWNSKLRSVISARYDIYDFDVEDLNSGELGSNQNSGSESDSLASLKGSLIYRFSDMWEAYISAGQGFHSNDARGTTIQIDPNDGSNIAPVDPLVRSFGYEAGGRAFITDKLNTSIALWQLSLDSELLFVGDAGNTEASGASERQGLEITAYYYFSPSWNVDVEYAYTDAEFSDAGEEGNLIPGSLEHVLQAGLSANIDNRWYGSLRVRHFGERPLIEDGSVTSDSSTVWNLRVGYKAHHWGFTADILNLSDSDAHDIDYFYTSRLSGEAAGQDDIHYHVVEPRSIRLSASYTF